MGTNYKPVQIIPSTLRRGTPEGRILAGYYCFNAHVSFTSQAIKNLYVHITYLRFGLLLIFFDDFGVYLGINSFSKTKSEDLMLL